MAEKLIHIFKKFLSLLFPQKCLGCGAKNNILCSRCLESLPYPENRLQVPKSVFKGVFAATSYKDETVKKAIRLFKYRGIKILAAPLAELIYQRLFKDHPCGNRKDGPWAVIPIPLSKGKIRQRGYNQSELLGQFLSDKLSVRMVTDVLYKIKETVSQVEIKDRNKRLKNVQGVFKVKNPEIIKNKTVILVDDIATTGATLKEASSVLKQAGAKKVLGVVVAR